jgi:hypothetical protein
MTPALWTLATVLSAATAVVVLWLIRSHGFVSWRTPKGRWKAVLFCAGIVTAASLVGLIESVQMRDLVFLIGGIVMMLVAVFVLKPRDERTI